MSRRDASKAWRLLLAAGIVMVIGAACGGGGDASDTAADPTTTTDVTAPTAGPTEPPTTTAPTAATPAIMPEVVCMNLQDAQNTIQTTGVFFSRSEDGTGQGRSQLVDRNWIVTAQTPPPGTPFGEGDAVLTAVKYGEPAPC